MLSPKYRLYSLQYFTNTKTIFYLTKLPKTITVKYVLCFSVKTRLFSSSKVEWNPKMSANIPDCPPSLKSIQHYLKTAAEHDARDPVVAYWCRLHALQVGLKITNKKTPEETKVLMGKCNDKTYRRKHKLHLLLGTIRNYNVSNCIFINTAIMDWLEEAKKIHKDNEAVSNEVAAQAHLENYALKLFLYADKQDREQNYGK